MADSQLKGRIALVTGANRGIGYEVCLQLARAGAEVVLTARDAAKGADAVKSLAKEGLRASFIALNATDAASIATAVKKTESSFTRIDVLVNNAGGFYDRDQTASRVDLAFARQVLELNLMGPWAVT
jgi:NAD(P)-dependent dehydrogenase (short-subunit alcohol dehydrogenase family)